MSDITYQIVAPLLSFVERKAWIEKLEKCGANIQDVFFIFDLNEMFVFVKVSFETNVSFLKKVENTCFFELKDLSRGGGKVILRKVSPSNQ